VAQHFLVKVTTCSGETLDVIVCGNQTVASVEDEVAHKLCDSTGGRYYCQFLLDTTVLSRKHTIHYYKLVPGCILTAVISDLPPEDIDLVQSIAQVSSECAARALEQNDKNVFEAILQLLDLDRKDVDLVRSIAQVSWERAARALGQNGKDIVEAIMQLDTE